MRDEHEREEEQVSRADGISALRGLDEPIVMVTGRAEEIDQVVVLEIGADDDVVRPLIQRELVARVRAHLRRGRAAPSLLAGKQ